MLPILTYGAQFQNKSGARIDWLPIRPLMTIYFAVSAGYRIYQFHDSRALMPALNACYDPLQKEATEQWLPIEAARKVEADLVARQKEEDEYRRRMRFFANAICPKCGALKVLKPAMLERLASCGAPSAFILVFLHKPDAEGHKPKCGKTLKNGKRCSRFVKLL